MTRIPRRQVLAGLATAGGLAIIGCTPSEKKQEQQTWSGSDGTRKSTPAKATMTVYRDPNCGCCEAWAETTRNAGYEVTLLDRPDMPAIKRQFGVPEELASCHTATIDGYVLEGHVPMENIARLLRERPAGLKGIAVAGMPRGAPGMEMPDGARDPFQVIAFDTAGRMSVYRG